ncbi:MAG: CoA-transferase [Candidatus Thorarchaeota archaeon]
MTDEDKVMLASEAIDRYVSSGDCVTLGGFTINRNPMALTHEMIRQEKDRLHVVLHSGSQALDLLIGAGLVEILEIAYGANGRIAPTCVRFRKAVEEGQIKVEDYSNYQISLRFLAGAMGVPYLPTTSGLGSDIVIKQGIDERLRNQRESLPDNKIIITQNPFSELKEPLVLVPAINPDVTLIHVQKAADDGTVRIDGLSFTDIEQARASSHVVVSCEELVKSRELRAEPWRNCLPHVLVDAVVHQPHGAYPTACFGYYDYDMEHLTKYRQISEDDLEFEKYIDSMVRHVGSFGEYLGMISQDTLNSIAAESELGYARRKSR